MHYRYGLFVLIFTMLVFGSTAQDERIAVPKQPNLRVVDYGSDMGVGMYRNQMPRIFPEVQVDVDKDGDTKDDSVSGWEFSMTEPLSPSSAIYNTQAPNWRYYGGLIGYHANQQAHLTEGMLNENHELRDDANLMSNQGAGSKKEGNYVNAWGFWFWKKEDFINKGDAHRVNFNDDSMLVVHISRYWDDVDEGRWVVRDGENFYISEATFGTPDDIEKRGRKTRLSWPLHPTKTRWARYEPKEPYPISFDESAADFQQHDFKDVTATGFYIAKDSMTRGVVAVKWHSFETYAVVDLPESPSIHLDMTTLDASAKGYMNKTELTYEDWHKVYNWAVSNQYAIDLEQRGYVFDRDGDMGSMDMSPGERKPDEPVTDITWLDAVLWCNALSELEGRTPCYYSDENLSQVLRKIRERNLPEKYDWQPEVYVKWDADGYRLPTASEWAKAAAGANASNAWTVENANGQTHPAGALAANGAGLYDMIGNVWEFVWPDGASSWKPGAANYPAMGMGFLDKAGTNPDNSLYYIYEGGASPGVGFRPMRKDAGSAMPAQRDIANAAPKWTIPEISGAPNKKIEGENLKLMADRLIEIKDGNYDRNDEAHVTLSDYFISATEIPYADWNKVLQKARMMGYDFDRDGDMGSMDWNTGENAHSPDEPVTDVGWFDSLVWCNALSELEGKTPVYYEDEAKTKVLRKALPWRIRMEASAQGAGHTKDMEVYTKWEADGYRLPTWAEWYIAWRVDNPDQVYTEESDWLKDNSGERTHPVSTDKANPRGIHDLGGNVAEWLHDIPVNDYYRPHNPKGDQRDALFGVTFAGGHYNSHVELRPDRLEKSRKSAAWPWLGFRVVRCEAGAHSTEPFVPNVVLDVKAEDFDPLQGRAFRGNTSRSGFFDTTGLPQMSGEKWKFKTGGPVLSSPVVVDGIVYIGSNDGNFYALDAETGHEKWRLETGRPIEGSATVDRDGKVYIGGQNGWLYALDAKTGNEHWKYAFNKNNPGGSPANTSPAVAHGVVFCAFGRWGGNYVGVDAKTGEEVWKLRSASPNGGLLGPTISGVNFYAPVNDNRILGASIRTEIPFYSEVGHHCLASIAIEDDLLCYNNGSAIYIAVAETNSQIYDHRVKGGGLSFFPQSGPAIHGNMAWFAKGDNRVYGIDFPNRSAVKQAWTFNVPTQVRSSIALAGSAIYFGCDDGKMYCLDAKSGEQKWTFDTENSIASSPWPGDGVLYFGGEDGFVYALE
ncbi:MAG: PQQ-binding-like beta-propeller repeat protein [Candidatus Sumerlaeia bacterium]